MSNPPPPPLPTFVSFSAEIGVQTTETLIAAMAQCAGNGVQEVHLLISTPGGDVMNGMNLYNVLRAMPFRLITHNVGNVDSIGNAIFLAGSPRYACPHATFMFHGVGFAVQSSMRFEEKNLREGLDGILANQKRIGDVISDRTHLDSAQIEPLFREAATKDANYAAGVGIIDEVRDVNIPVGAPIVALVFQR